MVIVRRALIAVVVLVLAGAACSTKDDTSGGAGDGAQAFTVQVDAHKAGGDFGFYASKFFPGELEVHAGDTVNFRLNWSGEPHSVTMGTLLDAGAAKFDPEAEEEPEEWQKVPPMLPEGPGDAIQSAVNPCFRKTGDPPATDACPEAERTQPEFDGSYTYYNSGFLAEGSTYSVKLAEGIQPGTYSYFCNLHRGIMTGTVTVVAGSETVPAPADVQKQADDEIAALSTTLAGPYGQSKEGMGPGTIFAGTTDPALIESGTDAGVTEFLPREVSIKAGETLKWLPVGVHTISVNTPQDAVELLVKAPDGTWHFNEKAGGPAASPPTGEPSEDGTPVLTDAGSWNGEGFLSSGILFGFGPPGVIAWQVTFATAGTYEYRCLVHPDMEGSVNVT